MVSGAPKQDQDPQRRDTNHGEGKGEKSGTDGVALVQAGAGLEVHKILFQDLPPRFTHCRG